MSEKKIQDAKKNIIAIGRLLWEKDLTAGMSGNISIRLNDESFLITATQTCLGLLCEPDIVCLGYDGTVLGNGQGAPSTEWRLHAAIYQELRECDACIHVHALHANAFFLTHDRLDPKIIEARHVLGDIAVIDQQTLNVANRQPVIDALKRNHTMVLRNHGCVTVGRDLFECFVRVQTLEEAVKTDIIVNLYSQSDGCDVVQ